MTPTRVFVYGTLLAGEGNHRVLEGARFVCESKTLPAYSMHDMGYFPAVVAGGELEISGEVYEVDAQTLDRLDRLEGHPRFYRRTVVELACGMRVETYLMPPARVAGRRLIGSGNWRKHERQRG
jgi:gamma-glutamylaminecyclotransferase